MIGIGTLTFFTISWIYCYGWWPGAKWRHVICYHIVVIKDIHNCYFCCSKPIYFVSVMNARLKLLCLTVCDKCWYKRPKNSTGAFAPDNLKSICIKKTSEKMLPTDGCCKIFGFLIYLSLFLLIWDFTCISIGLYKIKVISLHTQWSIMSLLHQCLDTFFSPTC